MAKRTRRSRKAHKKSAAMKRKQPIWMRGVGLLKRTAWIGVIGFFIVAIVWITLYAFFPPPTTPYMFAESRRLGGVEYRWVPMEDIAPVVARSVVSAEDAEFCLHWGFNMTAMQEALKDGAERGGSGITQQMVKNAFLWQGRSWPRKAIETLLTPMAEVILTKRRILELYLNIVEFDKGVFGIEAAANHYFGKPSANLTSTEAARLAAILPNPKARSASHPSDAMQRKAALLIDGAKTIAKDGRNACFER